MFIMGAVAASVFKPIPVTQRLHLVCEWLSIAWTSRRSGLLVLPPPPFASRLCRRLSRSQGFNIAGAFQELATA